MSEQKKNSSTRQATKGFLGGLEFGFIIYLCVLFLKVAINTIAGTPIVPNGTEIGGFAIGFSGGIVKALD
jgi:hypothetical protein